MDFAGILMDFSESFMEFTEIKWILLGLNGSYWDFSGLLMDFYRISWELRHL